MLKIGRVHKSLLDASTVSSHRGAASRSDAGKEAELREVDCVAQGHTAGWRQS